MANFSNFRRTTAGLDMLTKVESQGEILEFTRFKLGDGIWAFPDDVAAMTDLVSPLKIQPVGQVRRIDETRYSVVATITAADLPATGFHITEVGLYAQTDQSAQVLYGVVHAQVGQTDYLPGISEGIDQAYTVSIEITASDDANITLVVDNSGLLARQEMAEHEQLLIDPAAEGTVYKHLTSSQAKKWEDHSNDPHDYASSDHTHQPDVPVGKIDLLPFRYNDLPAGWFFCNGDNVLLSSAVGQALNSLSSNFKNDWGITIADPNISLPNLFYSDGRGLFLRSVDGITDQVGRIELDDFKTHYHDIPMNRSGGWDACYNRNPQTSGSATSCNSRTTNNAGGTETRPINTGMTPAIFLGV